MEEERYTRFFSPAAEYEFEYPAGWAVRDRLNEAEPEVGFIAPSLGAKPLGVVLRVCRPAQTPAARLLEQVLQELLDLAKSGQARVIEIRSAQIGGNRARVVRLVRTWHMPLNLCEMLNPQEITEHSVVERYLLIEREGRLYSVCYVVPEDHDARLAGVFGHVMQTFHFLPAGQGGHR
ncbi:hypothetical protein [Nitrospira sp. Kam-Ns4a]